MAVVINSFFLDYGHNVSNLIFLSCYVRDSHCSSHFNLAMFDFRPIYMHINFTIFFYKPHRMRSRGKTLEPLGMNKKRWNVIPSLFLLFVIIYLYYFTFQISFLSLLQRFLFSTFTFCSFKFSRVILVSHCTLFFNFKL